ncbi:hypothetical protein [Oricola thermophila]|uniref:Uncharacterized protein n=1 Tax=Oricola thermophila TaxID=2742145 RepID=A0A6N1VFY1_9HYPH|nr:hypothetical protein [Oricola thermophila]QKV17877.1 hypothetical protein HTY61_05080 [Oricola thermophila]
MATGEHERILALAKSAFEAEKSGLWKIDPETASEIHGERCEALWQELRRQVSEAGAGSIPSRPSRAELELQWKKEFVAKLRERLPDLVSEAIEA